MLSGGGAIRHHPLLNTQNHCEKNKKKSDWSYRNRKSQEIWGCHRDLFIVNIVNFFRNIKTCVHGHFVGLRADLQ